MHINHLLVRNKGEMEALVPQCAYDRFGDGLHFISLVGTLTAVKAIWASIQSGSSLQFLGVRSFRVKPDREDKWITIKGSILGGKMRHWLIFLDPNLAMDFPILPIFQQNGNGLELIPDPEKWASADKHSVLVEYLRLYTLWPVMPEWGEALWTAGLASKLVKDLESYGFPWAYRVNKVGWDKVIDQLVKEGKIEVPNG